MRSVGSFYRSSASAPAEEAPVAEEPPWRCRSRPRGQGRQARAVTRPPSPVPPSPQEEAEEEQHEHEEHEEQAEQEEGEHEEEEGELEEPSAGGSSSSASKIWLRGPSRLPEQAIPFTKRPVIRPNGPR